MLEVDSTAAPTIAVVELSSPLSVEVTTSTSSPTSPIHTGSHSHRLSLSIISTPSFSPSSPSSSNSVGEVQPEECVICILPLLSDEGIRTLSCNHRFHETCIEEWMRRSARPQCPLCREPLPQLPRSGLPGRGETGSLEVSVSELIRAWRQQVSGFLKRGILFQSVILISSIILAADYTASTSHLAAGLSILPQIMSSFLSVVLLCSLLLSVNLSYFFVNRARFVFATFPVLRAIALMSHLGIQNDEQEDDYPRKRFFNFAVACVVLSSGINDLHLSSLTAQVSGDSRVVSVIREGEERERNAEITQSSNERSATTERVVGVENAAEGGAMSI